MEMSSFLSFLEPFWLRSGHVRQDLGHFALFRLGSLGPKPVLLICELEFINGGVLAIGQTQTLGPYERNHCIQEVKAFLPFQAPSFIHFAVRSQA